MLHIVLGRMLNEHGRRCVRLTPSNEYRVGSEKAPRGECTRLQTPRPDLRQRARYLPRSELHRLSASLRNVIVYYTPGIENKKNPDTRTKNPHH